MDLFGKIYLASSKGHNFILVAIDYFKEQIEKDVMQFIKEQIIHRFEIPQSIINDQGSMFTRDEMTYFSKDYDIILIKSTPFYAQANEQVEACNKVLISFLEKMLEDNPSD